MAPLAKKKIGQEMIDQILSRFNVSERGRRIVEEMVALSDCLNDHQAEKVVLEELTKDLDLQQQNAILKTLIEVNLLYAQR